MPILPERIGRKHICLKVQENGKKLSETTAGLKKLKHGKWSVLKMYGASGFEVKLGRKGLTELCFSRTFFVP